MHTISQEAPATPAPSVALTVLLLPPALSVPPVTSSVVLIVYLVSVTVPSVLTEFLVRPATLTTRSLLPNCVHHVFLLVPVAIMTVPVLVAPVTII